MFRITEDPSSGSLVQYLAKITKMFLSCPLTWTWSVLWQHAANSAANNNVKIISLHTIYHNLDMFRRILIIFRQLLNIKFSYYRPGVAQRVGRGIALLLYDRSTIMGWVVSSTPQPHFTPGKDPVPIVQEAGWGPGPVWTGGKSRTQWDSIPNRPACS